MLANRRIQDAGDRPATHRRQAWVDWAAVRMAVTRTISQMGAAESNRGPESEWMRLPAPQLRIVSDDVWHAAHERIAGIRARLAHVTGRAVDGKTGPHRRGNESAYLLSGFARCASCGGGIGAVSRQHGGRRVYLYECTAYHKRGTSVCGNGLAQRIEIVDESVLRTLGGDVLRPKVVDAVLDGVLEAVQPDTMQPGLTSLRRELAESN